MIKNDVPRGIENNNPGNIKADGTKWQGLNEPASDGTFCRFATPAMGIRALCRTLLTYQDKRLASDGSKIDTVREVIERYAPASENHTDKYIQFVRDQANIRPGQFIDMHDPATMRAIIKAIIHFENGSVPYSEAQITKGMMLAGIEDAQRPLAASRTMKGAQVAGGATVLGMAVEHADELGTLYGQFSPFVMRIIDIAPWIVGAAAIGGVGYIMWARWSDHRSGVR